MSIKLTVLCLLAFAQCLTGATGVSFGREWSIPLAGNTFCSDPLSSGKFLDTEGNLRVTRSNATYFIYFHVDRPGTFELALMATATDTPSRINARIGEVRLGTTVEGTTQRIYSLGEVLISRAGYVRVELSRESTQTVGSAHIGQLVVSSVERNMVVEFVQNDEGNMFYWGRRGPSVHLSYLLPVGAALTHAYSEITVPEGQDPVGSYYMANGFSEGYLGIQVNSASERRVLFSVWSPYATDDPTEIPDAQRVVTIARGAEVRAQDFGNEGSGGQSYLLYPWKAGVTYRFLTEVKPDGSGNTIYTSWFGDKRTHEWHLLARFLRPMTDTYLTGFHSFLENFDPRTGNIERSAQYGNHWVCDTEGKWHEITQAKFTADATARHRQRLDFAGGSDDSVFFLRNCGFFSPSVTLDQLFQRKTTLYDPSEINFAELPHE